MSLSTLKLPNLPKLDDRYFTLWKMQITSILEELDLLHVVINAIPGTVTSSMDIKDNDENETPTSTTVSSTASFTASSTATASATQTAALNELKKKSTTAYNIFMMTLSTEQLHLVIDVPRGNAHGVWIRLLQKYERQSVATKTQLRNQLHNVKCYDGDIDSIEKYIARIKELVILLSNMNSRISNDDLIYILFKGLPDSYASLIDTLQTNDKLTFDQACDHIRDRHERIIINQITESTVSATETEKVYYTKHNNNTNTNTNTYKNVPRVQRTCETCNMPGHIAYFCNNNKNRIKCDYCRKVGHNEENCFFLPPKQVHVQVPQQQQQPSQPTTKPTTKPKQHQHVEQANAAFDFDYSELVYRKA